MDHRALVMALAVCVTGLFSQNAVAQDTGTYQPDRTVLPMPFPPFGGTIGQTYKESEALNGRNFRRRPKGHRTS